MSKIRGFKEISPYDIDRAIERIGKEWMLITAKDGGGANAMTASWGSMGELWSRPVATCFIRPQRYTFELVEDSSTVSLAFFGTQKRTELAMCGKKSGRDCDKIAEAGFSLSEIDGTPVINEAEMLIIGKKLYADFIREDCFIDRSMLDFYKAQDFHKFYIFEIVKVLVKE